MGLAGQKLVRINLSEQTDMMDLLGADLPVQGGAAGQFAWSAPSLPPLPLVLLGSSGSCCLYSACNPALAAAPH